MLEQQNCHNNAFCSRTANFNLTGHGEELKRNPTVHKVIIYALRYWSWDFLLNKGPPMLSTLNELEEIIIYVRTIRLRDRSTYEACATQQDKVDPGYKKVF